MPCPFSFRQFSSCVEWLESRLFHFAFLSLICWGISGIAVSAEPKEDTVDSDYSEELPRIAPKSPADAMKTFHVAPGFRIEQVAAEPLVTDPVAMAFDENGRLYVVEMRDYSEDDKANLGQIRLLEDTNEDGRFDKSTVFVDGLSWPTAVGCWNGGIFVAAAPHIYYFKDTNGDGKADEKKLLFTGFGRNNVQGMLNTFLWSLDNRIVGSASSNGGEIIAGPDLPKPEGDAAPMKLQVRGHDFSIEPRTLKFEAVSGGAQHGTSFDAWGNRYVCSNSDHLQQVMFEDRYIARNPFFAPPSARLSIAADGPQADVFRTSPVEPWRIVRTRLRVKKVVPGAVEGGGRPAGYFTGATGATVYRGDAWPREFQGLAIVGDVGSNLVHRKRLEPNGVSNIGRRIDEKSEFVTSDDIWFRPVQFANAPDGTLYIADMYREVIEHPASIPPVIKKHLDLTSGRDRGRIYRVVYDGFQQPKLPKLGSSSTAQLVATLAHTNGWHRDTAARLLYERQDRAAIPLLEKLATESKLPEGRIHAIYALDGLLGLTSETILPRLSDEHPRVREHAVRVSEKVLADSPAIRARLVAMADDADLRVRYQLAFTLGATSGPQRDQALVAIVRRDPSDPWIRVAVRSSLAEGTGAILRDLAADNSFRESAAGREWLKVLAEQIGRQQRADDVAAVLGVLKSLPASDKATLQIILQGLAPKAGSKLKEQVAAATGGQADALAKEMLAKAVATAGSDQAKPADRVAAIQTLRLGKLADSRDTLNALLEPAQTNDVQNAAIATLASFTENGVAELLVERWPSLTPKLRTQAADVLFSRNEWVPFLLDAVTAAKIAPGDIEPARWKLLAEHRDAKIRERAAAVVAKLQIGKRNDVVESYRGTLQMAGDAPRGRELFKKTCAGCHQLAGMGFATGPNLAAMKNRGPEAILLNVLDPNREVNPQYLSYTVATIDGRTLSGMIAAESATSVTLKRADNASDTVLRIDIEQMRSSGMSLMPEGMEKQIDKQGMADLLTFLRSLD